VAKPGWPGYSVTDDPRGVRRAIGYMPDFFGVYEDMKVWEYLDFFAACYDIPAQRAPA
jgi:ABC-2 type transport system ATP-binding protein